LHALASWLSAATSIETILLFLTMSVPLALHERFVDFSKDGRFNTDSAEQTIGN
jgi:hypothetical protein